MKENMLKVVDEEKIDRREIGRVYFVAGIIHPKIYSNIIKSNIKGELSRSGCREIPVGFFDDIFYVHLEYKKENKIILGIINDLENNYSKLIERNDKILIFAHSWGGILAKTAIAEFLVKMKRVLAIKDYTKLQSSIVLVTMATPHSMTYGGTRGARNKLKTPINIAKIKMFTFGGVFDVVVPAKFAFIKNAEKKFQNSISRKIRSTHLMFLFSTRVHREIFGSIFK